MGGVFLVLVFVLCVGFIFWYLTVKPTYTHDYDPLYQKLPKVGFAGDVVTIRNIRDFSYTTEQSYTQHYYTGSFDLSTVRSVDYILVPFIDAHWKAHVMLSFGFENGTHFVISPEGMREKGELYSLSGVLLRNYELAYLVVDEKDALTLRAIARNNQVYLYPLLLSKERMKELARDMLSRAQALSSIPTWYSLFSDACSLSVIQHIQRSLHESTLPLDFREFVSGFSDWYLYDNGLISTSTTFATERDAALVSEKIWLYRDSPDFSEKIREVGP